MKQWIQKIFISLAILLVCGHAIFPHHHHDEDQAVEQHHDHDDDHDLFSTGHLDDAFVPGKIQCGFHFDAVPLVTDFAYSLFKFESTVVYKKPEYSLNHTFPPPGDYHNTASLRGPPMA